MCKRKYIAWRGPIVGKAIAKHFGTGLVLDVGGSIGDIAAGLEACGAEVWVMDTSHDAWVQTVHRKDRYIFYDITAPLPALQNDLVICFEVLSILPKQVHETAIYNLTLLGNRILCNHIEAIPGYTLNMEKTEAFRKELEPWGHKQAFKAVYRTATFFEKADACN